MHRFRHILVPLDFTEKNRAALEVAFDIAVNNRARVTLLHVIETFEVMADDEEIEEFYRRLETRADSQMESLAQRFTEAGVAVDWKVRYGKRLREIVEDVTERGIDLVVLSSHRIDPHEPARNWGTLSYQASVLCPCPVLLVK